jgi:predicted esterase
MAAEWPVLTGDECSSALSWGLLGADALPPPPPPRQTASQQPARTKVRILCLHGYEQTGAQLRAKSGGLRRPVNAFAEFHFIDGPQAADRRNAPPDGNDSGRGWFTFEALETGASPHLEGLEASLAAVAAAVDGDGAGAFDGVLGFSQGAALVAALAIVQAYRHTFLDGCIAPPLSAVAAALVKAAPRSPFGAFVFVSGFLPNDAGLLELCAALQQHGRLPLHTAGRMTWCRPRQVLRCTTTSRP